MPQLLRFKDQSVAGCWDQSKRVVARIQVRRESKLSFDSLRSLRAVMEERLGPANSTDVNLEMALPHLTNQLEKADEVRLPGPVRPDEDSKRVEFDLCVPDRFPSRESQAGQLCHFTPSFCRLPLAWDVPSVEPGLLIG